MSTFNLLANNNQTFWICGLNIYGSDIVNDLDASTVNPSPLTKKAQNRPPNQDYDLSLESPQKFPPEGSYKISVNNNQKEKNKPYILSLPGRKFNHIQTKRTTKNSWNKTGEF